MILCGILLEKQRPMQTKHEKLHSDFYYWTDHVWPVVGRVGWEGGNGRSHVSGPSSFKAVCIFAVSSTAFETTFRKMKTTICVEVTIYKLSADSTSFSLG
jgi:hypothetical protein